MACTYLSCLGMFLLISGEAARHRGIKLLPWYYPPVGTVSSCGPCHWTWGDSVWPNLSSRIGPGWPWLWSPSAAPAWSPATDTYWSPVETSLQHLPDTRQMKSWMSWGLHMACTALGHTLHHMLFINDAGVYWEKTTAAF